MCKTGAIESIKLIRKGRVFDVFKHSSKNSNKIIIKRLVMNNKRGRTLLHKEISILSHIKDLSYDAFCELVDYNDNELSVKFIEHLEINEGELNKILDANINLIESLAEGLVHFNDIFIEKKKTYFRDELDYAIIKSFVKLLIRRKNSIKFGGYLQAIQAMLYVITYECLNAKSLVHNDFREGNVLIDKKLNKVFIIDYDRATIASKFLFRDIFQFCLFNSRIDSWSWEYKLIERYLITYRNKSLVKYSQIIKELTNRKTVKSYMISRVILNLNSTGYVREMAKDNMNLLLDSDFFDKWYENFISIINNINDNKIEKMH